MNGANPLSPGDTWARPRTAKQRKRLEDRLADAIDTEERARAKMRRATRAWDKAQTAVDRLNAQVNNFHRQQVQS